MFNARCETVAEKSVFGRLLQRQRCVVLFDGFYEWKKEGSRKQPFYVNTGEGNIMRMAGLFDVWSGNTEEDALYTYTILTTDASKKLEWLHDRMPVLLTSDEQVEAWLDTKPVPDKLFSTICTPYNGEDLVWHPVTPSMSSMSYQSADASKEMKRPNIASFFLAANKAGTANTHPIASKQSPVSGGKADTNKPKNETISKKNVKHEQDISQGTSLAATPAAANPDQSQRQHCLAQQQPTGSKDTAVKAEPSGDVSQLQFPTADGQCDGVTVESDAAKSQQESAALNPDDGDGIVAGVDADAAGVTQQQQTPTRSNKRRARPQHGTDTQHTKRSATKSVAGRGTLDSFFGKK